jgi:DNA-binding NarL/FixJ family response regulator
MQSHLQLVTEKIAIAIVEDDAIAREGLTALLRQQPGFTVAAALADVAALASLDADADVILIDAGQIVERAAVLPVVADAAKRSRLIATRVTKGNLHLADLVRAGVSAFALRDGPFSDLVKTIRSVAEGARVMPPGVFEMLVHCLVHERDVVAPGGSKVGQLTAREREIALLIANGKSNKEIAELRCISPHTAKSHVRNIMEKLSVHTRLQIAARANREGWPLNAATLHVGTAPQLQSASGGPSARF